jgi:branched-chain amino acid transport system permease protein
LTFALSVGITAMIGGVWSYYIGFIYPGFAVDPLITIGMVLMVYLGGKGTLWGPALGAAILVPAQQYLAYRLGGSQLYLIGYACVFLVVVLLLPQGVIPSLSERMAHLGGPSADAPIPGSSLAASKGVAP